jgi:hypothetical protein
MPKKKDNPSASLSEIEFSLRSVCNRLVKLFDMKAPDMIKFNEFKLMQARFEEWCGVKGFDPKREWMDDKIDREKMH